MFEKVKVLYFVDRLLIGGIQTFILNNIKHIDREKVQIDFLILDDGNVYDAEKQLADEGYNIYRLKGIWVNRITDYLKYSKSLDEFFSKHCDYKVIHYHSSSKNFLVMKKAKKYGIPVRIAHSHSIDFQTNNYLKKVLGNIFKIFLVKNSTDFFACSENAGKWLFGENITKTEKFHIVHNAVDIEKFKYNEEKRNQIRKQLGIANDTIVYGHVGRLNPEKNHKFLIGLFKLINEEQENSKLLLLGTGKLENELKAKVNELDLSDKVIFAGFVDNVNEYMSAMDVFIFPSTFEGLGLVLIEAQANGLKCYASKNAVPNEAKVSEQLEFIELDKGQKYWAEHILKSKNDRCDVCKAIEKSGYKIENMCKYLESFYTSNENSI